MLHSGDMMSVDPSGPDRRAAELEIRTRLLFTGVGILARQPFSESNQVNNYTVLG